MKMIAISDQRHYSAKGKARFQSLYAFGNLLLNLYHFHIGGLWEYLRSVKLFSFYPYGL